MQSQVLRKQEQPKGQTGHLETVFQCFNLQMPRDATQQAPDPAATVPELGIQGTLLQPGCPHFTAGPLHLPESWRSAAQALRESKTFP